MKTREIIEAAYAEEKENLERFLKIAKALEVWEGKKINKRIAQTFKEALGDGYCVYYAKENSRWDVVFWQSDYNKRDYYQLADIYEGDRFSSKEFTDKNPSHYKGAILRQEERTADLATDRPERIDQAIARLHAAKKDLDEVLGDDWTKMPDLYQVQRENNLNR